MRAHVLKNLAVPLLALTIFALPAAPTRAQDAPTPGDRVKGNIAGTVGLGLLGAEVGVLLTPAFNLQDHWWAWVLFPALGAAGGAVAGAFAFEPRNPEPAVTVSILGASMLLAVPAVVGASALKTMRQSRNIDRVQNEGILRFGKRGPEVGVPTIQSASVFTPAEQARFGLPQRTSMRATLISGRF